ncbi:MAG: VWA domain-containing protein [Marinobacterium sp.]|nr:VWA domain-containing protein [Marinobacterium sp.]
MTDRSCPTSRSNHQEIDQFLKQVRQAPALRDTGVQGRLIFALDATLSRQPTWDQACHIQSEMFNATRAIGGLQIQLCYYRGFAEFSSSEWLRNTHSLTQAMNSVSCLAGRTQLERLLNHACMETRRKKVQAVIFIGDCVEEEVDRLFRHAGELGLLGTPVFMFQEGNELVTKRTFKRIAELSGGAWCHFDAHSAQTLKALLAAVAVFASGGRRALEDFAQHHQGEVRRLVHQLR